MLTVTADSTVVTGHPMITINQRSLRAEVKVSDSGTNMKLYAVHMNHIYYFVRFCLLGSKHRAIGHLGVSAYIFDDSRRAYASVRVGLRRIAPIYEQDESGNVIMTDAIATVVDDPASTPTSLKLKFIMYKYAFENWEDEVKVTHRRVQKEAFGRQVQALFDECVRNMLIRDHIPSPIIITTRVIDPEVMEGLRPTAEILAAGRIGVASYNVLIRRVDFSLLGLSLVELQNGNPFDPSVFTFPHQDRDLQMN